MSLRVLLADESASIRKVFQMGLQDFGAEVKSVQNGLDVVEVARSYKPHIIFADILLQKKNGYEVCEEIKQSSDMNDVPVILMWSSFMELDQKKYQASGAQGELEKPFEVENMRRLITDRVEFARSQKISEFLKFPQSIKDEFVEEERQAKKPNSTYEPLPPTTPENIPSQMPPLPVDNNNDSADIDFKMELETPDEDINNITTDFDLDPDFMGRVASHEKAPSPEIQNPQAKVTPAHSKLEFSTHLEDEDIVEAGSFFNTLISDDEDEEALDTPTVPPPPFLKSEVNDMNEEPWAVKPLHKSNHQREETSSQLDDSDEFQSMDLHKDHKKMDLNDFLYKPSSSSLPPEPEATYNENNQDQISKVLISDNTENFYNKINPEESEAIIRSETRKVLKEMMAQELSEVLEKVVREELNKILKQELELKSQNQPAAHE